MNFYFFIQKMELLEVLGSGNTHRCREIEPCEATIYGLHADKLEKFAAISKVELIVVDEKQPFKPLELPVDFSKENVVKVIVR